ncbi:pigment epithelium-derived factor [Petromyzon marinus]|uniref:pigment epithelium-derived factor n=1 Tax=Petromyzon marinus TaxID=7757 RepID=UPI003F6F308C
MARLSPLFVSLLVTILSLGFADHHGHTKPGAPPVSAKPAISPFVVSRLAGSQGDFGFQFFHKLGEASPGQNVLFSPLTTSAALMMLLAGSGDKTETQLTNALRLQFLRDPNPQASFQALVSKLHHGRDSTNIAARIFTAKHATIKQQFLDAVEKYYKAKPQKLIGNMKEDVALINKWVAEKTEGHIPDFVKELPEELQLFIVSAIFFKGKWLKPFQVESTSPRPFHLSPSNETQVPTMFASGYPIKKGRHPSLPVTVAQIQFQGNTSLLLFVPDAVSTNLSALESSLSSQLVTTLVEETLVQKKIDLYLPLISLDVESNLEQTLTDIGLGDLFKTPDLSKISDIPLRVSKVIHRATMTLNEEGVKATAATGIMISLMSVQHSEELKVDRPFVFLIRDDETGALLFVGRVTSPPPVPEKKKKEKHGDSSSSEEHGGEGKHGKKDGKKHHH